MPQPTQTDTVPGWQQSPGQAHTTRLAHMAFTVAPGATP